MVHLSKVLPLALLLGLGACADMRVSKSDLERNDYEITPLVGWLHSGGGGHEANSGINTLVDWVDDLGGSDDALKQNIKDAAAGLCGPRGIEVLDVERPAYITVPMTPRGYLHCR